MSGESNSLDDINITISSLGKDLPGVSAGLASSSGSDDTCLLEQAGVPGTVPESLRVARDWSLHTAIGHILTA